MCRPQHPPNILEDGMKYVALGMLFGAVLVCMDIYRSVRRDRPIIKKILRNQHRLDATEKADQLSGD